MVFLEVEKQRIRAKEDILRHKAVISILFEIVSDQRAPHIESFDGPAESSCPLVIRRNPITYTFWRWSE